MSVYFAKVGDYIKIGYSADPASRMTTVTRNGTRPDDIQYGTRAELLGWIPGDRKRETWLHRRFAEHHVAGEWFRIDADNIRGLIWSDPRGVDVERMTAIAVSVAMDYPTLTRGQLAAAGIQVESPADLTAALDAVFSELIPTERRAS
jgi:hypothetical protein